MKLYRSLALISIFVCLASSASWAKIYGTYVAVDLTNTAPKSASFGSQFVDVFSGAYTPNQALTWTVNDSNHDGIMDDPDLAGPYAKPRGRRNLSGWIYADTAVHLYNVDINAVGWAMQIYTDNTGPGAAIKYIGPNTTSLLPVGGLVSADGRALLPMSWLLTTAPLAVDGNQVLSPVLPEEIASADLSSLTCQTVAGATPRITAGFCDFSTHYISDKGDHDIASPDSQHRTWWQYDDNAIDKESRREYQTPLNSNGAATLESYRSPYPTIPALNMAPTAIQSNMYLYFAAKFPPGTLISVYRTNIYLEFITQ